MGIRVMSRRDVLVENALGYLMAEIAVRKAVNMKSCPTLSRLRRHAGCGGL
jgi:hypothetical protein